MCVIPQCGYKTQSPLSSQMKHRRHLRDRWSSTVCARLGLLLSTVVVSLSLPLLGFRQRIPSRVHVTEPREGGYKSPSLEVWVSLNIMGGGAVLIAAR